MRPITQKATGSQHRTERQLPKNEAEPEVSQQGQDKSRTSATSLRC